jgi:hypothetical protein
MNKTDEEIEKLLEKSIITQEMKDYWFDILDRLNDEQKNNLLNILQDEQQMIQTEIEREKSNIYRELLVEMKTLAKNFKAKYVGKLEVTEREKEEEMMKSLEDQLNNL